MKVDFDAPILNLKGEPMKGDEGQDATFGAIVVTAMFSTLPGDDRMPTDRKVRSFKLAMMADKGGEATITPEDASLIKERVTQGYNALVVGRVCEFLDG